MNVVAIPSDRASVVSGVRAFAASIVSVVGVIE